MATGDRYDRKLLSTLQPSLSPQQPNLPRTPSLFRNAAGLWMRDGLRGSDNASVITNRCVSPVLFDDFRVELGAIHTAAAAAAVTCSNGENCNEFKQWTENYSFGEIY